MIRYDPWSMSVFDFSIFCMHFFLIKKPLNLKINDISYDIKTTNEGHFQKVSIIKLKNF